MIVLQFICAQPLSRVRLFVTLWTVAHRVPLSVGLSRQELWSGVHVFSSLFIWTQIRACLSLCYFYSLALASLMLCSIFLFFSFLCHVRALLSVCFGPLFIFLNEVGKKKKHPCGSSLPVSVQDGRGAAGKPMASVFHDHIGSRISYRDQTTSTPFPPCSSSFRDKPSNLLLDSLSFAVYIVFVKAGCKMNIGLQCI